MVSKPAEPAITEPSPDHPTKVACPSRLERNPNGSDKFFPGGRQDNIAELDEAGDEHPRPQFRFIHLISHIRHRPGAGSERCGIRCS